MSYASAPPDTTPDDSTPRDSVPVDETTPDDAGGFAVQPSGEGGPGGRDFFIYTFKVGQVYGDTVAISNLGTEEATFAVYATDAQNTSDGSFSLLREEEEPVDVGSWIELGATQYTLEPGTRVDIPFSISVPADASPGDHVGAIVAQKVQDPDDPDGIGLDVRVRIGARVYVRVDGPTNPSLAVDSFTVTYDTPATPFGGRDARVEYVITNTGDVRLSPIASLSLAGMFGLGEQSLPDRQIPELLPGGSIEVAETVQDVKPYVRLNADLTVKAESESVVVNSSLSQWVIPWTAVALLVLIVLGIVVQRVWVRRKRKAAT